MAQSNTTFATTQWSIVSTAGDTASPEARAALEHLCRTYWFPLYAYVRRRGHATHDAQDLTQAFFAQLLEHGYLARADPRRGRFRTFLVVALNHFLTNEWHRQTALKRGGAVILLSWDQAGAEATYLAEAVASSDPEALFERRWALTIVERAVARVAQEMNTEGRAALFEALKPSLVGERETAGYAALATQFGTTEAAIKMTALRLRRRFASVLRDEVAQTVVNPADVEDELRHMLKVLSTQGGR